MNDPSASEQDGFGAIPRAKRVPKERTFHGDTFIDQYEWLRDKQSQDVQDYVAAQNRYCEQCMAPLASLRKTLFDEFKSHVQETDMSVPTRMDGYWYFTRTMQGRQYATQCRVPICGADDWDPPTVEAGVPLDGEQVVFDTNVEAEGHDFFRIGGMDISKDGRWMLYGTDTTGDERYDFRIRDLETGDELEERFEGIGGACFTPDAQWVFYVLLDGAWRPYAVMRHRVGTPVTDDVEVYREADERFWVGIGLSFDERNIVIGTGSKTTTEVLMLPVDTPEGSFRAFIPRETDVEYDVSFACFEGAGEHGEDIPLAVVYHNALNPNFEIDVIDMRTHEPPYRLGEGVRVAVGSPYGCEHGDDVEPGASSMPIGTPYSNPCNPAILQGAHGLGIEGISIHRHFVALQYRAETPAAHRGDDETGRRRGFPGRPAMAVHRTGAARAGGRLGRRRIRGRDQRGTRRDLGQTGRGRRRARQGIGRAWRLASGDDVVGRRHRRPHAGGDAPPVFDRRWWQPLV